MVCADDVVGLYVAYVNVLSRCVPYSFAVQIPYSDIASAHIETTIKRQYFESASMIVDANTCTLTLELTDGRKYRVYADAGSSGRMETHHEKDALKVSSRADQSFRMQIGRIGDLIQCARGGRKPGDL